MSLPVVSRNRQILMAWFSWRGCVGRPGVVLTVSRRGGGAAGGWPAYHLPRHLCRLISASRVCLIRKEGPSMHTPAAPHKAGCLILMPQIRATGIANTIRSVKAYGPRFSKPYSSCSLNRILTTKRVFEPGLAASPSSDRLTKEARTSDHHHSPTTTRLPRKKEWPKSSTP